MHKPNNLSLADFYSADAEALLTKFKQIQHLLGLSHHSPSEGTYCESLLKEFLRRTLPGQVSVDGGFIRRVSDTDWTAGSIKSLPPNAPIATPQLDIIIHDTQNYSPLFRSEDFVVVLPEAVRAVIEVKQCLDASKLKEAVNTLAETTHLLSKWRSEAYKVFTGIFAFSLHKALAPKKKLISKSFRTYYQKALTKYDGNCALPHLAMALPRFALQQGNPPEQYNYCPTVPDGRDTPNVAGQFLVFLLSYFTSSARLPYPDDLRTRRQKAFTVTPP